MKYRKKVELDQLFKEATTKLFPELDKDDYRLKLLADYARKKYHKNPDVRICVLCAIDGHTETYKNFYWFCKQLGVSPGRREAIISDGHLYYTDDYSSWPKEVNLTT